MFMHTLFVSPWLSHVLQCKEKALQAGPSLIIEVKSNPQLHPGLPDHQMSAVPSSPFVPTRWVKGGKSTMRPVRPPTLPSESPGRIDRSYRYPHEAER